MKYRQIYAMVTLTIRETARDRSCYALFFLGAILLMLSMVLGKMAVGGGQRIVQNTGFWILGVWGILFIIQFGSKLLKYDFENKAIYMILSRPVSLSAYLLGKFAGTAVTLFLLFLGLVLIWVLMMASWHVPMTYQHLIALGFIFGEWLFFLAVSLMVCSFASPFTHHFLIFGLFIMGHLSSDMLRYAHVTEVPWLKPVFTFFYYALPNLEALNFRSHALYGDPIGIKVALSGAGVLLLWICTAFVAAAVLWHNKKIL